MGSTQPFFGWIFSKILNILVEPITPENEQKIKDDTALYSLLTFCIGLAAFIGVTINKYSFGSLGENVTLSVRKDLYKAILRKDVGFHDDRENGTSVLTSAMAEDTALVNGISTESIGPMVDGGIAITVGLAIGFFFSWKMALICLGLAPLMAISSGLGMMLEAGQTET